MPTSINNEERQALISLTKKIITDSTSRINTQIESLNNFTDPKEVTSIIDNIRQELEKIESRLIQVAPIPIKVKQESLKKGE